MLLTIAQSTLLIPCRYTVDLTAFSSWHFMTFSFEIVGGSDITVLMFLLLLHSI